MEKAKCFSKERQQIGHAKKADPVSEKNRKQNWKMGFQTGDRTAKNSMVG